MNKKKDFFRLKIGVLALQGAFVEHETCFDPKEAQVIQVRSVDHLNGVHGLIMPGGESPCMSRLLGENGLLDAISDRVMKGMPVWGICAGAILLSKSQDRSSDLRLSLMDLVLKRNAFGRQIASFIRDVRLNLPKKRKFRGVFIRAPRVLTYASSVRVLAFLDDEPVAFEQDQRMATFFHPELTEDRWFHRYFLSKVQVYALLA